MGAFFLDATEDYDTASRRSIAGLDCAIFALPGPILRCSLASPSFEEAIMSEIVDDGRVAGSAGPQSAPAGFWLSLWLSLRALGRVLWLTRFSFVPLAIGAYALLGNDETQEVLREFAARDGFWGDIAELVTF